LALNSEQNQSHFIFLFGFPSLSAYEVCESCYVFGHFQSTSCLVVKLAVLEMPREISNFTNDNHVVDSCFRRGKNMGLLLSLFDYKAVVE
jgi:hypothetical protein